MGNAQLKIDSAVKTKMATQISKCFDDAAACVDGFDSGRLMLTYSKACKGSEPCGLICCSNLPPHRKKSKRCATKRSPTAIDNALGTIANEIGKEDKDSSMTAADILKTIVHHRSHFDNSIVYSAGVIVYYHP